MSIEKVFYCRISSEKSDLQNQLASLTRNWGEPDRVVSEQISGGREPLVLIALIGSLHAGSIIYTVALDRLTRLGIEEVFKIRRLVIEQKIEIMTELGPLTQVHPLTLSAMAYMAMAEREATIARMQRFHEKRKEDGKIGYKKRVPNPLWIKALPRIREMHAHGMSTRDIARAASTEFGRSISPTSVQNLLKRIRDEHISTDMHVRDSPVDAVGGNDLG